MQKIRPSQKVSRHSATGTRQVNKRPSFFRSSDHPVALRVYTHSPPRSNCDRARSPTTERRNCMFGRMLKTRTTPRLPPAGRLFATRKLHHWREFRPTTRNVPKTAGQLGFKSSALHSEESDQESFSTSCCVSQIASEFRNVPQTASPTPDLRRAAARIIPHRDFAFEIRVADLDERRSPVAVPKLVFAGPSCLFMVIS